MRGLDKKGLDILSLGGVPAHIKQTEKGHKCSAGYAPFIHVGPCQNKPSHPVGLKSFLKKTRQDTRKNNMAALVAYVRPNRPASYTILSFIVFLR